MLIQHPSHQHYTLLSGLIGIVIVIQHLCSIEISISTIVMIQMQNKYVFIVVLLSGLCEMQPTTAKLTVAAANKVS